MRELFSFIGKIVVGTIVGVLTAGTVAAIGLAVTDSAGVTDVQSVFKGEVKVQVDIPPDLEFLCVDDQSGTTTCTRSD